MRTPAAEAGGQGSQTLRRKARSVQGDLRIQSTTGVRSEVGGLHQSQAHAGLATRLQWREKKGKEKERGRQETKEEIEEERKQENERERESGARTEQT